MTDILLNDNYQPTITNGDWQLTTADRQNVYLLLSTLKGEWKQTPFLGVGLKNMLNDEAPFATIKAELTTQLELDGARLLGINFEQGNINVNALYTYSLV